MAHATETGGGAYPNGAESLTVAALPPPGTYLLNYTTYYSANRFNDGAGKVLIPDFSVGAFANVFRFVHIYDFNILGASFGMQAFVPIVDLDVKAAGAKGHKTGIGDLIVNPFILGWHLDNLHIVATMDTYLPTGGFNKNDVANIGRNYFTFEPVLAFSYFDPKGGPEFDLKLMYDFNTKNNATDYQSGQEFHADYAVSYNFVPWTLGVSGYYYRQTTNDYQFGSIVGPDGFKGEAFAIGPMIRYVVDQIPITFQWQHEVYSRYRPEGDKFWLKAVFRF
jgi:hypothetical protein